MTLLAQGGAAIVVRQVDFTPEALAQIWRAALADFAALRKRAEAAQRAGVPDAAERLADLVAHTASPA